jgi:large subunit ribosomal protein L24
VPGGAHVLSAAGLGEEKVHIKQPRIKKNDKVIVLSGKEKGKIGGVLKVDAAKAVVVVEKVNMVKRHSRPSKKTAQGGIIEKEAPVNISNVMVVCNKCAEPAKIGMRILEDGSKVRICKKCKEPMDD